MSSEGEIFNDIRQALARIDSDLGVAECHGLLCGIICAAGDVEAERWQKLLSPESAGGDLLRQEAFSVFERLRIQTLAELADSNLGFSPLLAPNDAPLEAQVNGLGEWCSGFLLGVGEGGIDKNSKLPEDSREFLADLVRMSNVADYDLEGGDEDDHALFELVEYLRTGVLLFNEELHPTQAPPRMDPTLH